MDDVSKVEMGSVEAGWIYEAKEHKARRLEFVADSAPRRQNKRSLSGLAVATVNVSPQVHVLNS